MRLTGRPGAPGSALGDVWVWRPPHRNGGRGEVLGLDDAALAAAGQLRDLAARVRALGRDEEAGILDAQAMMAVDPALLDAARALAAGGEPTRRAIALAGEDLAEMLTSLGDPVLSARAADVRDVAARIARTIAGEVLDLPDRPSIVLADDLPPSVTAEIPAGLLLGIVLAGGSPTAHAAILAGSLGIPAVVAVDGIAPLLSPDGQASALVGRRAGVNGTTGEVVLDPDAAEAAAFSARIPAAGAVEPGSGLATPVATRDGRHVPLLANIGRPEEAEAAIRAGAEGIGLFRTEFLFLGRLRAPGEDEQVAAYRRVFDAVGTERPCVVRLADIGGDKEVPYLGLPAEANPFLGVRAIRLGREMPELLTSQLRAILRAAAETGVTPWIMAPMVATTDDVELFRSLVEDAVRDVPGAPAPRSGVMIEVPSSVLLAAEIARRVDFVSIGTNDLTQYLFAADRTNGRLAAYQDAHHPAVLRAIAAVVAAAHAAGIPVAVCGELAGDPAGARLLVGLGVDELSMAPRSMPRVAEAITSATVQELARLAAAAIA